MLPRFSIVALVFASACATPVASQTHEAQPQEQAVQSAPSDPILSESVAASRTVERDGMTCLQALDSYGNVVEERCAVAEKEE